MEPTLKPTPSPIFEITPTGMSSMPWGIIKRFDEDRSWLPSMALGAFSCKENAEYVAKQLNQLTAIDAQLKTTIDERNKTVSTCEIELRDLQCELTYWKERSTMVTEVRDNIVHDLNKEREAHADTKAKLSMAMSERAVLQKESDEFRRDLTDARNEVFRLNQLRGAPARPRG